MTAVITLNHQKSRFESQTLNTVFPAILGTMLEYYDYTLYGFCATQLAFQFFPNDNSSCALLKIFAVFFAGSLSKPIGALIFGVIGDRYGRRVALKISMVGIAIPTLLIGVMPTYSVIGWVAPCLLLMCRLIQGICTAGESDGARIFIYESMSKNMPCLTNSITDLSCMVGIYLASLSSSIALASDFSFAWRLPFILGSIMGALVFWSRTKISESAAFNDYLNHLPVMKRSDLLFSFRVFIRNQRGIFSAILLCGAVGGGYHFYLVFFGNYISVTLNMMSPIKASFNVSEAILIYTLCTPIAGFMADKLGAIWVMKISSFCLFAAIILNGMMIIKGVMPDWLIGFTAATLSFMQAPGFVVLFQKFSIGERYRCASMGHAIGSVLFSGSAPFISYGLWYLTNLAIAPLFYFAVLAVIGFVAILLLEDE